MEIRKRIRHKKKQLWNKDQPYQPSYNPIRSYKKIEPIEIGTKVLVQRYKIEWIDFDKGIYKVIPYYFIGFINKQMFPGYGYKNTCIDDMRYGITSIKDENHSIVVSEYLVKIAEF